MTYTETDKKMPQRLRSKKRSAATRSTQINSMVAPQQTNKMMFAAAMLCSATLASSQDALVQNYLQE